MANRRTTVRVVFEVMGLERAGDVVLQALISCCRESGLGDPLGHLSGSLMDRNP